ncbi:polybromo-1 [Trichoderma arundinaceum]|uniref:Polybromo-1 n=1 Tax=Trichoderma arundinaceum TaxID=490622 RepID=A0A395NNG7_TRIAR|nr:polybromo-1 [Trichoderma arundinaceum]
MEAKRKANGTADAEDRTAKRRRVAQDFDLSKGESRESTTAHGLVFLEQIRRTADKSGRLVATYFEKLVPRESNPEYYKRTRLPISLETIEEKLNDGDFKSLAQLESYFKRMIANAKDFYSRGSQVFDDAERVRKALSNYMTKTNPAYSNRSYQAVPTPLPPESADDEDEEGEEGDEDEEEGDEDAEGEDAEEDEDAEGEDEDAEGEEEPEEDEEPRSRRKAIILKRRGPSRTRRSSNHESSRARSPPSRPDHQYENVPYKGLTFQQAQEKIVEELLRHQEPEYDDAYFEPFINLPPRALKDYYKVITDPLSIKKLQKIVKGVHGRHDATGVSDFKTWSAFEEKTKLLWTNAYFYNEEGSDIYVLAQELEKAFYGHLKKAQAAVSEPSQPKIKLKVGQGSETPGSSKKITIHVGGRDSSVASPAPQTTQPSEANGTTNVNGSAQLSANLEAPRSVSASAPSPTPSSHVGLKVEDSLRASPAVANMSAGTPGQTAVRPPIPVIPSQPFQTNPLVNGYADQRRFRPAGKGIESALIEKLRIQTHPSIPHERPTLITILPNAKEMQQSATINLPPTQTRIWIVATLPTFLQDRQYSLWTLVDKQPWKQLMQPIPNQTHYERAFDVMLHPGLNVIETHLIAAIPRHEREPGGPEAELEVFTVLINVSRPY